MYEAETNGILVRVAPSYIAQESDPEEGRWFWAYTIEVENRGARTVQLVTRHWRITDALGARQAVDGDGVIGKQPVIRPGTFENIRPAARDIWRNVARRHCQNRWPQAPARDHALPDPGALPRCACHSKPGDQSIAS